MKNKYSGMTVNERLYASGLFEEFDKAVEEKKLGGIIRILKQVELTEKSIQPILEQLGFPCTNKAPTIDETIIIGHWVDDGDGNIVADEACHRINWLIESVFELIETNESLWTALYRDPSNNDYWELSYPNSHVHGGGAPQLRKLRNQGS